MHNRSYSHSWSWYHFFSMFVFGLNLTEYLNCLFLIWTYVSGLWLDTCFGTYIFFSTSQLWLSPASRSLGERIFNSSVLPSWCCSLNRKSCFDLSTTILVFSLNFFFFVLLLCFWIANTSTICLASSIHQRRELPSSLASWDLDEV